MTLTRWVQRKLWERKEKKKIMGEKREEENHGREKRRKLWERKEKKVMGEKREEESYWREKRRRKLWERKEKKHKTRNTLKLYRLVYERRNISDCTG